MTLISRRAVLAFALANAGCAAAAASSGSARAAARGRALKRGPLTPILGPARAPRVLAFYYDYNCPYCRAVNGLLRPLVAHNPDLRILFKQFPVLSDDSETAARIALSAALRGRFFQAHELLMQFSGTYTGAVATRIARALGFDPSAFRRGMGDPRVSAEIRDNLADAHALGIDGTPGLVTAHAIAEGGQDLAQLQGMITAI
ncbi:MAG TPA: DsbA family protein [Steroidobacteraceae bacterium]|nr:DsbA family protein [Steroidobacteraceae bacterium]